MLFGSKSKSKSKSTTNYDQRTDARTYGADDGSISAGGAVSVRNTTRKVGDGAISTRGDVTINSTDSGAVSDAFAASQYMFDRALDSVDVVTDAYGQSMSSTEASLNAAVASSNDTALEAISAAQPESEKTIMTLAGFGIAGLVLIVMFLGKAKK